MKKFIITSDSSCDLTQTKINELDVKCAFLSYSINGNIFYDDMIESHIDEFYQKMRKGAAPKTSQVPPAQFKTFFEKELVKNKPILHLSISASLSGTYKSAQIAAEEIMENDSQAEIRVLDSTIGSAGLAILIFEAVKYRDKGKSIDETIAHLNAIKEHINTFITTDDLTYMKRGGRVSTAGALVSSVMKISPLITFSKGGKLYVCNKIRGSRQTLEKFVESVKTTVLKPEQQILYIVHADAIQRAKIFGEELQKRLGFKQVVYMKFGTTIGSHAGPGVVSAFYLGKLRPIKI